MLYNLPVSAYQTIPLSYLYRSILSLQTIMLHIPQVEQTIGGAMSTWQQLLQFLFTYTYTPYSAMSLATFFYGNKLELSRALQLVSVCHYEAPPAMRYAIAFLYHQFSTKPHEKHFAIYWNLRHKQFIWQNGANCNQHDVYSEPGDETNDIPTGFGCCGSNCSASGVMYMFTNITISE